jgi:hypothetical protein
MGSKAPQLPPEDSMKYMGSLIGPPPHSNGESLTAFNARALRLFYNRLTELFSRMEHQVEFGKVTLEQSFEEGRAVGLARTYVEYRDKL